MKHLIASLLLCFCLITQPATANQFNDMRSMPFIEMMVTMMRIMNQIMGGSQNFSGLNAWPYSAAFMPGMGGMPGGLGGMPGGLGGMNGFNSLPLANGMGNSINPWQDSFQAGQNSGYINKNPADNFWGPDDQATQSRSDHYQLVNNTSLNGIWQALSGEVLAIYNNNRFMWSDGNYRSISGQLVIKGNAMIAYIPVSKTTMRFQFYKTSRQFIVRDQSSRVYTFKRIH